MAVRDEVQALSAHLRTMAGQLDSKTDDLAETCVPLRDLESAINDVDSALTDLDEAIEEVKNLEDPDEEEEDEDDDPDEDEDEED